MDAYNERSIVIISSPYSSLKNEGRIIELSVLITALFATFSQTLCGLQQSSLIELPSKIYPVITAQNIFFFTVFPPHCT